MSYQSRYLSKRSPGLPADEHTHQNGSANGFNGKEGGDHHEEGGFSDRSSGSFGGVDLKIAERPKGNTVEAFQWDIDQRDDKIKRLNKKLETCVSENVRLTFCEPTRKPIKTSQDMELQNKNEQIAKLQQDLSFQKQDEANKVKKLNDKAALKQTELQGMLDKSQRDRNELDSKWKQKLDVTSKNLLSKQHELDVSNKRLKEEIHMAKKETLEAVQLKDGELNELKQLQEEQLNNLNSEFEHAKANYTSNLEYEANQRIEGLKAESNSLLAEARKRQASMETEKVSNEKALNSRLTKLEDMLMKKNRETEQLLRDLDQKKGLIEEQHRNLNKTQKEFHSTTLSRNEEFEAKLNFERQKNADDLKSARESYVSIIAAKDETIANFEADILNTRVEKENNEKKLSGEIESLSQKIEDVTETNRKQLELLHKEKAEELDFLRTDLTKQIETLKHELKEAKIEMESEKKLHNNEKVEMLNSHKLQLETLQKNSEKEINALKDRNVKERTELETFYHKERDVIYKEKVEMEKSQEASRAELHKAMTSKALFESMKEIELNGLKDEIEKLRRERECVEKEYQKSLEEKMREKDKVIADLKSEQEKVVIQLIKELDERKAEYEKGIFEMEQEMKQRALELQVVKADSESFCKQKDRLLEKLKVEAKAMAESVDQKHKTEIEEKEINISRLQNKIEVSQSKALAEFEQLRAEFDAVKETLNKEKQQIIEKYATEIDELNHVHFDLVRELHQKRDEDVNALRNEIRERDLKIKDLEELVKTQELNLEEHQRNTKSELDVLEARKTREIEKLLEEINTKNKHIDLVTTLHQSELKQKAEKYKSATQQLRDVIAEHDLKMQNKMAELNSKQISELNAKDETVAQLKVMLKELNGEKEREVSACNVRFMLQREEWFANVNELTHQHLTDLKVKEQEIEALNDQIKDMMLSHDNEIEQLKKTIEDYREDFEKEKRDMNQFREELREERNLEVQRLNEQVAKLQLQKTQLREQMLNQENQLQEQFFQETCVLKSNFTAIKTEIEQRLDETLFALQNMTHERDMHIQEGLNKDHRIGVLEGDLARLKQDLENKIEEMSREIARLNEEKKTMFEQHQKAMDDLLEEKRQMEIAKDKELHETKLKMAEDMKKLKAEMTAKINQLEEIRNNLDIKIKDLKQKYTAMVEEKDNELVRFTRQTNEKHQNEINNMNKQYTELLNDKDMAIEALNEDLRAQKVQFEEHLSDQKNEFERVMKENEIFIKSLQEQHNEVVRNNEEHIDTLKRSISEKDAEHQQSVTKYEAELKTKNEHMSELNSELNKLQQEMSLLEAEAGKAQSRGQELVAIEENLKNKHAEIANLTSAIKTLQATEKEHLVQIDEKTKELVGLKDTLSEKEMKLRETSGQLLASQKTMETLKNDIGVKDKTIAASHQNAQQEKYTREAKETKIEELLVKVNSLTSEVKRKEELVATLQKKVDDLSHAGAGLSNNSTSRRSSSVAMSGSSSALTPIGPSPSAASTKWTSLKNEVMTKSAALNKSSYDYDSPASSTLKSLDTTSRGRRESSTTRDSSPGKRTSLSSGKY